MKTMFSLRADIGVRDMAAGDAFVDFAVQVIPE